MTPGNISSELRDRVRREAKDRCGYCLSQQQHVLGLLEIEHITPQARGGTNDEGNLWLACRLCNGYKGIQTHALDPLTGQVTALFNPREHRWSEHFAWSDDGTQIIGITACGRATVIALRLNNVIAVMVRRAWVTAGWHPPRE